MIHALNPIAIEWGGFILSWYWLSYFIGFLWIIFLGLKLNHLSALDPRSFLTFCQWGFPVMILSSRLFFVCVYHPHFFWNNPSMIPKFWLGGMSFHGALIGPALLALVMSKRQRVSFYHFTDLIFIGLPLALFLGRVSNFVNGELYGRASHLPWAMIFPLAQDEIPRHPSQLYQAITEGILLGLILWWQRKMLLSPGYITLLFIGLYGFFRFFIEFTREPDVQLGTWLGLSMGQYLCVAMILLALYLKKKSSRSFDIPPQ